MRYGKREGGRGGPEEEEGGKKGGGGIGRSRSHYVYNRYPL